MTPVALREVWICEECGEIHAGVNPPDVCGAEIGAEAGEAPRCGGALFENGLDVASEGRVFATTLH
jgi:hypothetical protein